MTEAQDYSHASADAITPEVAEELRAMYAVAKTVNGNTALDDPRRETSLELSAALQSLIEQGVTVYRLAKVLGVRHGTVYNRLARHGYRKAAPSVEHKAYRGTTAHDARRLHQDGPQLTATSSAEEQLRVHVRAALEAAGISQAEACRQFGLSTKHMSQMLTGRASLTLMWAEGLLGLCGMAIDITVRPDTKDAT